MVKIIKKASVCTTIQKNENGFSLVEVFISLMVISSILLFIPTFYKLLDQRHFTDTYSARQFFHFLNDEIQANSYDYHTSNSIHFISPNDENISVSLYGSSIRRQVNRKGQEILIRDITNFTVKPTKTGIQVLIRLKEGDRFAKKFTFD
ncbi:competence type IV pilus minor pilin ComGF [Paraliobacillus ryukyuensis]|uniref:competence type IV pilus minor pilin ComGF n=1 Tax=Paraliobacillus ryukyuensis TaxID=200904 RepID=UPI0009A5EAF8|nr:competence type IV pilus minor pilin ComGF [Paraliobacillus ryukyuensis]